jgi:hypothetical protein
MSNALVKAIDATAVVPTHNRFSPFRPLNPINASSPGAGILYGVDHPGQNTDQYIRVDVPAVFADVIEGTGSATADAAVDPKIDDAFIEAGGTLGRDENLSVVALVNGQPIERVAKGTIPTAGKFRVYDNGGVISAQFGTSYGEGTKIELLLNGSASAADPGVTDLTGGALTAGVDKQIVSAEYVFADAAFVVISALGC